MEWINTRIAGLLSCCGDTSDTADTMDTGDTGDIADTICVNAILELQDTCAGVIFLIHCDTNISCADKHYYNCVTLINPYFILTGNYFTVY